MPEPRHVRVVSLWIHPGQEAVFEAFEQEAEQRMARHGGRIDSVVRVDNPGGSADAPYEIHVVSFPDAASVAAYAGDPETLGLLALRNAIISRTVVVTGRDAGPY